jgi:hypothetical protein
MVWIFGDSFSLPFVSEGMPHWAEDYITWKGYVPISFGELISTKVNQELTNLSVGGSDNDTIFELILINSPLIKKDDIIIIGWSSIERFRLQSNGKSFSTYIPNWDNKINNVDISKNTINEILVNRTGPAYLEELKNRLDFINWLFNDNVLIQWSHFKTKYVSLPITCNSITKETKGELVNGHYSELGHRQLSDYFLTLIEEGKLKRNTFNPI